MLHSPIASAPSWQHAQRAAQSLNQAYRLDELDARAASLPAEIRKAQEAVDLVQRYVEEAKHEIAAAEIPLNVQASKEGGNDKERKALFEQKRLESKEVRDCEDDLREAGADLDKAKAALKELTDEYSLIKHRMALATARIYALCGLDVNFVDATATVPTAPF